MINCTHLQQHIGCGHFIRGRISASFHSPINTYFRCNHLGKCFACSFWFRSIIPFLWDLHHNAWLHYCNNIDSPDKTIRWITTAKSILLHIVDKYILEAKILPKNKRIFFACKKLQYQSWNITELQNWLSSARCILRRYRDRTVAPTQLIHNKNLSSQHIVVHRPPNHNHYTVSTITKYYPKSYSHIIPTSIDLELPKDNSIPTTSTTIVSNIPSVRNTSSSLASNYYTPRSTSLNQSTANSIPLPNTQLDPRITHFRSKIINISIPTPTLLKSIDHKIYTNFNNINTKSVTDTTKTKKIYSAFSRKSIYSLYIKNTPNPIHTTHDLHIPINKYFFSKKLPISLPPPLPS